MVAVTLSDREVITGFLTGEATAHAVLDRWIAGAAAPFRSRLGIDWEDLLQDTRAELISLLRRGSFRAEASLKTYIWKIVNHACLRRLRAARRWPRVELGEEMLESGEPTALQQAMRRESETVLWRILAEVPAECRALWRRILGGESYAEIGRTTGVSEGALRVRALRCRRQAMELWRRRMDGGAAAGNIRAARDPE